MSCTEWGDATLINVPWIETDWDDPEPKEEIKKTKNNCFVHFIIEGESGSQYGIYNPEANLVMCACCGGILFLDEGVTILETMEMGFEAYDAIMDAFEEERLKKKT